MGRNKRNKNRDKNIAANPVASVTVNRKVEPKLIISGYVNELVIRLHQEYPRVEWSGLARIVKKNGYFTMTDIRFAEQENSAGNTEMTQIGLDKLQDDLLMEDPKQLEEYRCWIHSHHGMGCFWSGTDHAQKESFNDGNQRLFFSVVTAYKGDNISYKGDLDIYQPIRVSFDLDIAVEEYDETNFLKENIEEYDLMMKAMDNLEKTRDDKILSLQNTGIATEKNISDIMEMLNVSDSTENRSIVVSLLEENNIKGVEKLKIGYEKEFQDSRTELIKFFKGDVYATRLKQLKDCIIKPKVYSTPTYGTPTYPTHNAGRRIAPEHKVWEEVDRRMALAEAGQPPLADDFDDKREDHPGRKNYNRAPSYAPYDDNGF